MHIKQAFSLQETLLTLVMIGLIAVLTLPNIINTNQNKIRAIQTKKAQSFLQAVLDAKIMISGRSTNQTFISWINNSADKNKYHIGKVESNENAFQTTDEMIFYSADFASDCLNGTGCKIYVDINAINHPTKTNINNAQNLVNLVGNINNKDVISFQIINGIVEPLSVRTINYLNNDN